MAGAFTHMAIVSKAIEKIDKRQSFGKIIRNYENFVTLGSVSPDIPYLAYLSIDIPNLELGGFEWADIMHYYNTNGIVNNAIHSLLSTKSSNDLREREIAWLAGFISHLVVDATIHPIVECIVGPCTDPGTKEEHTFCEMTQDVLVFKEVMKQELIKTEYTRFIDSCIDDRYFDSVIDFWMSHAKVNCPSAKEYDFKSIVSSYKMILDTAEGGSVFAGFFRHIGENHMYKEYKNINLNNNMKYYAQVSLPNNKIGSFIEYGFNFAVDNLVIKWDILNEALFSVKHIYNIIPNWNLDTGIDQLTGIRTYWR